MARGRRSNKRAQQEVVPAEDWSNAVELVPEEFTTRCQELVERTDALCDRHLDEEYKGLCRKMAAVICQEGSPVRSGKAEGWVAGIVYALGQVNFLTDPTQHPHMTAIQIAEASGVSQATMHKRAGELRDGLELMPFHPEWCLPSRLEDNPLAWMLEVNGLLVDAREAPREVQEWAYEQGLIPYVPADRSGSDG